MKDNQPMYERVAEIRKKNDITANVLAQAIGVSASTITRYERGEIPLNTDKAFAILDALNCDIEIIENPLPRPSADRLRTIAKTQIAEDIIELQFLALYGKQKSLKGRERLIRRYSAGYYEIPSNRPTLYDMGVQDIDDALTEGERKGVRGKGKKTIERERRERWEEKEELRERIRKELEQERLDRIQQLNGEGQ